MGRRILAFFLGMIFGWIILVGGVVLAAAIIKPSTFGANTDYVNDAGKSFDDMPLLDIIIDGVKLINDNNLSINSVKSAFGVDLIDLLGLDSQNQEFDELKNVNFADQNGLKAALGGIKLSSLAPLLNGAINDEIVTAWKNSSEPPTLNDLTSFNMTKVLGGVTLKAVVPQIKTTGIEGIIASKDLGTFVASLNSGGNAVSFLLDGARIGDVMNYTYDENSDAWLNGDAPVTDNLVLIVADVELSEITNGGFSVNTMLKDVKVGEMMGYDFDEQTQKWFDGQKEITDKVQLAIANIKATQLTDGSFSLNTLTNGLKTGDVLGFVYDESAGTWKTGSGAVVTDALTVKIADLSMTELLNGDFSVNDVIDGMKIGDVMGYTFDEESGKWFDGEAEITDKLTINLAERDLMTVKDNGLDLSEIVKGMKVGDLMGYTFNATQNKWYNGESEVTDTLTLKLIDKDAASLADGSLDFASIARDIKMGELMGYVCDDDGKWFDGETEITDRLTLNIASKTLGELSEANFDFDVLLEGVTFGELIGVTAHSPVIMQKLADTEITRLEEKLNEMYIGDLLDYHRREIDVVGLQLTLETVTTDNESNNIGKITTTGEYQGLYIRYDTITKKFYEAQSCKADHTQHTDECFDYRYYDKNGNKADGINNIVSNLSVSNLDTSGLTDKIMNLPLSEFYQSQQSGVLSLIDTDTSLSNLPAALTDAVSNAAMGTLIENGIIEIQCAQQLDAIYQNEEKSWREMSITEFVDSLVSKLASVSVS